MQRERGHRKTIHGLKKETLGQRWKLRGWRSLPFKGLSGRVLENGIAVTGEAAFL